MAETAFRYFHRVDYADCTSGNHVFYGRYLEFLEAARGAFFRAIGQPLILLQQNDSIFPVLECHVRYLAPARYDDLLQIQVWLDPIQGARIPFRYAISNQNDNAILQAQTIHVCTTLHDKPKRIPTGLRTLLALYARPIPSAHQSCSSTAADGHA